MYTESFQYADKFNLRRLNNTAFMTVTASLKTGTSLLSSCLVVLIFSASGWQMEPTGCDK